MPRQWKPGRQPSGKHPSSRVARSVLVLGDLIAGRWTTAATTCSPWRSACSAFLGDSLVATEPLNGRHPHPLALSSLACIGDDADHNPRANVDESNNHSRHNNGSDGGKQPTVHSKSSNTSDQPTVDHKSPYHGVWRYPSTPQPCTIFTPSPLLLQVAHTSCAVSTVYNK